jgi:peptide/nickel transport system substrate-binding protein
VASLLSLASVLLVGCVSNPTHPASTATTAQKGGTITLALSAGWDVLDPAATAFTFSRQIMQFIYDPLLARDPKTSQIVPGLAQSFNVSADGNTITLKIRPNVKFHDGTVCDAAAVAYSLNRIQDPALKSPMAATISGPVSSITASDASTVVIVLKKPFAPFLDSLTQVSLAPVSSAAVSKYGKDFGTHPVGTGPFKFESTVPNDNVVLVRNPDYNWAPSFFQHQGPAYLDKVVIRNVPEDATRMALEQAGTIDVVYAPVVSQLPQYQSDKKYYVVQATRPGMPRSFILNTTAWPFNDLKTRQAVAYAINKSQILQTAYGNIGSVADSIITPNLFGYSKTAADTTAKFDIDKAKKALADAGWTPGSDGILVKDGKKFSISYGSQSTTTFNIQDQVLQANLKAVGIDLKIETEEQAAILADIRKGKWPMATMLFAATDPDVTYTILYSKSIGSAWNTSRYSNAEMDTLLEQGRAELDQTKRAAIYDKVQKLVAQDVPYIPYYNIKNPYIVNARVHNFGYDIQAFWVLYDTWVTSS